LGCGQINGDGMEMKLKNKKLTEEEIEYLENKQVYEEAALEESIWRYLNR